MISKMKKIITIIFFILIIIGVILFYKADKDVKITSANTNTNSVKNENNVKENNIIKEDYIEHYNTNKEDIQEKSQQAEIKNEININAQNEEIKKEDDKSTSNSISSEDSQNTIKEILSPNGFMGSSLLKVALYSNGEVYLINYDGEGYEENNISGKELLATNVSSIYSKGKGEEFEAIVIKGSANLEIKNKNYSWIEFKF